MCSRRSGRYARNYTLANGTAPRTRSLPRQRQVCEALSRSPRSIRYTSSVSLLQSNGESTARAPRWRSWSPSPPAARNLALYPSRALPLSPGRFGNRPRLSRGLLPRKGRHRVRGPEMPGVSRTVPSRTPAFSYHPRRTSVDFLRRPYSFGCIFMQTYYILWSGHLRKAAKSTMIGPKPRASMQIFESEVPGTPLLRGWVNNGKRKGRGCSRPRSF